MSTGLKFKICIIIVLGILVANRVNSDALDYAAEVLCVNEDYSMEEIAQCAAGAFDEAKAVMAEASDLVVKENRTQQ